VLGVTHQGVDILQFTKIAKLGKPLQALFEIITKLVKKTGVFVAKGVVELVSLFSEFIELLKKGTEEVIAFAKKIFEAVRVWLEELLGIKKEVGMAENIKTTLNVEEFLASAKRLENIKPEEALKYLDDALIHFNHKVIDGVVVQIGDKNCAVVVQMVEDYLQTGKIKKAIPSKTWNYKDLENVYDKTGLRLDNIEKLNKLMKEGERGIAGAFKSRGNGHVINVLKENGVLKFVDGQIGQLATFTPDYEFFKYFKTLKL
jgi:hypothetical protein